MRLRIPALCLGIITILSSFCHPAMAADKINVFVSIPPQKYFVQAIGKDRVIATAIVSPAHSPADYEPSPAQMRGMATADIYFSVGLSQVSIEIEGKAPKAREVKQLIDFARQHHIRPVRRYRRAKTISGFPPVLGLFCRCLRPFSGFH